MTIGEMFKLARIVDSIRSPRGANVMSTEQIGGIVRALIQVGAGLAISKGYGDDSLWQAVGGGLLSIATGYWSFRSNKGKK